MNRILDRQNFNEEEEEREFLMNLLKTHPDEYPKIELTAEERAEDSMLINVVSPIADRTLIAGSLVREFERALVTLSDRERDIVKLFFGIGVQEMSLEEIGEKFGLTRECVRQIKEQAIRRLRHSSRSKLLKCYLE